MVTQKCRYPLNGKFRRVDLLTRISVSGTHFNELTRPTYVQNSYFNHMSTLILQNDKTAPLLGSPQIAGKHHLVLASVKVTKLHYFDVLRGFLP